MHTLFTSSFQKQKTKNKNKFIETMERGAANSKNNFSENMKSIFSSIAKKKQNYDVII